MSDLTSGRTASDGVLGQGSYNTLPPTILIGDSGSIFGAEIQGRSPRTSNRLV